MTGFRALDRTSATPRVLPPPRCNPSFLGHGELAEHPPVELGGRDDTISVQQAAINPQHLWGQWLSHAEGLPAGPSLGWLPRS